MRGKYLKRFLAISFIAASCLFSQTASGADDSSDDRSPDALQAKLEEAEKSYKAGKVDAAIKQATELIDLKDSSVFESDSVARDAKADLVLFQLKSGNADQSAKLISELLIRLQLELPMDPKYATNAADVIAESITTLKTYFGGVVKRLNEKDETRQIIDSLIDNTIPKDYRAQLKTYCARMDAIDAEMRDLQSVADAEGLRYGDSLSSLDEPYPENKSDPKLSADRLEKLDKSLVELATQARQLPIGDVRAGLDLCKLALVANSAQRYWQAELFAQQAISQIKSISNQTSGLTDVKLALAYALLKQGKMQEFNTVKDEVLKECGDNRERQLVTMARFSEATGDNAGAVAIYKRILNNRKKQGNAQVPDWMDAYNNLVKSSAPN